LLQNQWNCICWCLWLLVAPHEETNPCSIQY
jgi:hypothetical protein